MQHHCFFVQLELIPCTLCPAPPAPACPCACPARLLYRERQRRSEGINFKALPLPPGRGGHVQQVRTLRLPCARSACPPPCCARCPPLLLH